MPAPGQPGSGRPVGRAALGRTGESLAATYLTDRGLRILARNVVVRGGELDLVATDGPVLVFIEVRTRALAAAGVEDAAYWPLASVNAAKQRRLCRSARDYLAGCGRAAGQCRIDVVGVAFVGAAPPNIVWLPAAITTDGLFDGGPRARRRPGCWSRLGTYFSP